MTKQRLGPNQERWLKALESRMYRQCQGRLSILDLNDVETNCCLGVGCRVFRIPRSPIWQGFQFDGAVQLAPPSLVEELALYDVYGSIIGCQLNEEHTSLVDANDNDVTFAEIAAFCREYPEAVFSEPR